MIILINGSINSGKSTISKILSQKIPNSALVEIDSFAEMIDWMPIYKSVSINLENAVSVIKNFVKNNLNVIVPYPLSRKNYDYLKNNLEDLTEIYIFTLSPKLEKVLTNRGERKLTEWETERIKHHYNIGINNPDFGEIIDNTDISEDKTAQIIFDKIKI